MFRGNGIFPVGADLEKSDWLSFLGAYLSFIGTVIVSMIAIFHSRYYSELNESKKFTPALYREKDGVWEGGSTSQFSPVMIFKLWERFSEDSLEVSEIIEVNGRRTFGYDDPIVYKRKSMF